MKSGARGLSIAGGLIAALGLGQAIWGPVLEGRVSASHELRAGAWAAAFVGLGALILARRLRGARVRAGAAFVQWMALPAAVVFWLAWYLVMHAGTKEYAYRAAMQSDLRDLALAEEAFHGDSGRYAGDTMSLGASWASTSGILGPKIVLTADGFQAVVGHSSTAATCALFVGSVALAPAEEAGKPECSPVSRHHPWIGLALLALGLVIGGAGVANAGRAALLSLSGTPPN